MDEMSMSEKEEILMLRKMVKDLTAQVKSQKILLETLKAMPGMQPPPEKRQAEVKDDGPKKVRKNSSKKSGRSAVEASRDLSKGDSRLSGDQSEDVE
jgi:hypothetical protein